MKLGLLSIAALFLVAAGAAHAQAPLPLDPSCTVTVGNQTAVVRVDGTFFVSNVSVFQSRDTGIAPQLYRVRATCLRGGQMVTGQSSYFPLTPGQTTFVTDVFPGAITPIPEAIEVTTPADFLPQGATAQLTVEALHLGGKRLDVSSHGEGTTYLSTNPQLLTVSADGLVTGANATTSPQTGTIAILHEGHLATVAITAVGASNDFDNDGMPNDYEVLFGLNQFADDAAGDLDGDGLTNFQEFQRGTLPNNPDTDIDGIPDGLDGDPLHPEEAAPVVTFLSPQAGRTLLEGETIALRAQAMDDGLLTGVALRVNGAPFGSSPTSPVATLFTVPYATPALTFTATASDSAGHTGQTDLQATVQPDPRTTVQGQVVDEEQNPVVGAAVSLPLHGVRGEFFDFTTPLSTLPDLTGLTPASTRLLSALNLRNPNNLLSPDTFGVGLAPDFAARFSGLLRIPVAGTWTFRLGADDGARLKLNGATVVEVTGSGSFTEAQGTVDLPAGAAQLVVEYFQSTGSAELQLAFAGPGGAMRLMAPDDLLVSPAPFTGITGADGRFTLPAVPANLGDFQAVATATLAGEEAGGSSARIAPVPGGVTDLGNLVVSTAVFETDLGTNLNQSDDTFTLVPFTGGFVFPFFGTNHNEIFVNSNGDLTFGQGDATFNPTIPDGVVNGLARISTLFVDLDPSFPQPGGGVYVHQLPDRFVVTWNRLALYQEGGDNTAQVILFADGRIQYGYNGLTVAPSSKDISVAVSPGGTPLLRTVDYTADTPLSSAAGEAVFHNFPNGAAFDLDHGFVLFRPNAAGGFDVRVVTP